MVETLNPAQSINQSTQTVKHVLEKLPETETAVFWQFMAVFAVI